MSDFEQRPLSGYTWVSKDRNGNVKLTEVTDFTVKPWRMVRTYPDGRMEHYIVGLAGPDRHSTIAPEPWYCIGCTYGDNGPQCAECHAVARYEQSIGKA